MRRREFLRILALGAIFPQAALASQVENAGCSIDNGKGCLLEETPPEAITPPQGVGEKGKYCAGLLRLKSSIHGESYEFRYRDCDGNYDQRTLSALNWFLRCKDGTWNPMDMGVIESLNYLSKLLGDPVIQINSGYRSPRYNSWLATKNENVARNSLHMHGQAIDFFIPGISVREVCSYTLYARNSIGYGGVGYYPKAGFVHIDSGVTKQWVR
jgi:uncharacterized protein YcbK (DUF882 family)